MILSDALLQKAYNAFLTKSGGLGGIKAAVKAVLPTVEVQAKADFADAIEERVRNIVTALSDENGMVPADKVIDRVESYTATIKGRANLERTTADPSRDKVFVKTFDPDARKRPAGY
ncbi:hypothetical protein [Aeromicrobium sp. 179-A 4D2 NHS]|uniref:hypothetical protein n=1 Tax=Aeromicrobium sp. 179-A 4D2 NHS TaxID=3142375 RepID=UPI0039A19CA3